MLRYRPKAQLQGQVVHHVGFRFTRCLLKQRRLNLPFYPWDSMHSVVCRHARFGSVNSSPGSALQEVYEVELEPDDCGRLHDGGLSSFSSAMRNWPPEQLDSGLFIVPTPIGRCCEVLQISTL